MYVACTRSPSLLAGLGDPTVTVDPGLLLAGGAILMLAMFLMGNKAGPALRQRKRARLEKKRSQLSQQLSALGD